MLYVLQLRKTRSVVCVSVRYISIQIGCTLCADNRPGSGGAAANATRMRRCTYAMSGYVNRFGPARAKRCWRQVSEVRFDLLKSTF